MAVKVIKIVLKTVSVGTVCHLPPCYVGMDIPLSQGVL